MRFWKNTKGAVSIFLVIILVPMMTVSSLFVDASKVKLARGVAESAGDLTLNTALTDYDTTLKDMYGLFATAQDTKDLFGKLEDYYKTCIISSGVNDEDADAYVDQIMAQLGLVAGGDKTADILNMQLIDFNVSKKDKANLANASIIKKQLVDFMKYRAPINTGLSFISALQSFSTLSKQTELVDKRKEYYEEQSNVMDNAQMAWGYINKYNKSGFVTSGSYFSDMKTKFSNYSGNYDSIARKIIKDLYDTQSYVGFTYYAYTISKEEIVVEDGTKKMVPIFYTNSAKTAKKDNYTQYTTYSSSHKATAENIKTALNEYNTAYEKVKENQNKLLPYNGNTYGLQYLVQTNRGNLYKNWVMSMATLYEKYCALRHAVTYSGNNDEGVSVMTTSEKLFRESTTHPYSWYYNNFMKNFDELTDVYNEKLSEYSSTLQVYANNIGYAADITSTAEKISQLYKEINAYRTTISDAKDNLTEAVRFLGYVYNGVKSGGTLEQKKGAWKNVANDDDLSNTSMARQDLAEIDSLSTYLNPTDVRKLIDRLNNIIGHLNTLLGQIDSYTYFGTKIGEISDYSTFINILKSNIGDGNLKSIPTDKTALDNQINAWVNGKFVIGNAVDVSWENQSGTQPNLIKDKLNFYSYLYTHFNSGAVSTNTTEKPENKENGEDFYNNIKSKTDSNATKSASGTDSGNVSTSNELNSVAGRPSLNAGSDAKTASAEVKTGDSAAKNTSASLSSMFSSLSTAVIGMGVDLRDKLYVSDYILSMFSYDTIEKEFAVKNPGAELKLQSLTLNPIDAKHNFAYGKEVEYVIYGGSNASNLTKAYGSIYGIRLGFNLIYAFMDSSIRDTAFAIATPISAATLGVIPVPLIQAAIVIGIACCESALDLVDLRNGESVPLFKNNQTWNCSIKKLVSEVKAEVGSVLKEVGTTAIDKGLEELNSLLDMTDDELTAFIEEGANDVIDAVSASYNTLIMRHANTAIQKLTTLCNNAIEEHMLNPATNMAQTVSDGLDKWLEEEASKVDTSSDLSYIVKSEAVEIIKSNYIQTVLDKLSATAADAQSAIANAANSVTDTINALRTDITYMISTSSQKVVVYKDKMKQEVQNAMKGGAESLKNTLSNQIDGIFGTSSGANNSDSTGMASLLSFSYSDYLRLFLMIGLYTNEEGILLRAADVIQANMVKATGNSDYKLSNSAVYVEIEATIQVKPTLLALSLFADVEGNPATNQNWYTINYKSVKGY